MYTLRDLALKARVTEMDSENLASVDDRLRAVRHETHVVRETQKVSETVAPAKKGLMLPELDLFEALAWMRARWVLIAAFAIIGGMAGFAYGMTAKPRYTAYTDLLVPPSGLQLLPNDVYAQSLQADSQILDIESKMRILTSGNVLRRVVTDLKLNEDEEFVPPPPVLIFALCWVSANRRVQKMIP